MSTSKKTDLQLIKKHYSETLAHICRELFPTLLETNGLLYKIVSEHFAQSKTLGEDIEKWGEKEAFKDYIYSFVNIQKNEYLKVPEGPEELMSKAGYVLFPECKTEADIQSFRHYYYRGEPTPIYKGGRPKHWKGQEICTFDGGRLLTCRVWFAVKKEVVQNENAIPRAKSPARQDAYGTSVLSIQFSKGLFNILSIKNRYSHAVNNPDATFGNDLDNIIPGLTRAFRDKYNLKISSKVPAFVLEDYIEAPDGKYYKYNLTYSSTFYCPNNTIIKNKEVKRLPDRYYLMDGYVVDFSSNTISMYDKNVFWKDAFIDSLGDIKKIALEFDEDNNKTIRITPKNANDKDVLITTNKDDKIIKLSNPNLTECQDNFLTFNSALYSLDLPKLKTCGTDFLKNNKELVDLNLPELKTCGNSFVLLNRKLTKINLPNLEQCGDAFLFQNENLKTLFLPKLKTCGDAFMFFNNKLKLLLLPKLKTCQDRFLFRNKSLTALELPSLEECGKDCMYQANLTSFSAPKLKQCGDYLLCNDENLKQFDATNLVDYGYHCLANNKQYNSRFVVVDRDNTNTLANKPKN